MDLAVRRWIVGIRKEWLPDGISAARQLPLTGKHPISYLPLTLAT
jgi:hypothetical protein